MTIHGTAARETTPLPVLHDVRTWANQFTYIPRGRSIITQILIAGGPMNGSRSCSNLAFSPYVSMAELCRNYDLLSILGAKVI